MKITVKTLKPRNPIVVHARLRSAGSHRLRSGAARQQARRSMQRELDRMQHSP